MPGPKSLLGMDMSRGNTKGVGTVGGAGGYVYAPAPDMGPGILTSPSVLTPSGGHHITYGWQAGAMHPTGMLSCYSFDWSV